LARANGVRTMVGLQDRGSPALLQLGELVEEGYVGEVLSYHLSSFGAVGLDRTSDRVRAKNRNSGVGTLNIQFGHYVDALCLCVGEISEVSAVVTTQVPKWYFTDIEETMDVTAPDNVLVSGKLANGAVISIHVASIPWHGSGPMIQVFGRAGTLAYHDSHIDHTGLEGARDTDSSLQEAGSGAPRLGAGGGSHGPAVQRVLDVRSFRRVHTDRPIDGARLRFSGKAAQAARIDSGRL